jgi:amino-acid N-acetyltransferase
MSDDNARGVRATMPDDNPRGGATLRPATTADLPAIEELLTASDLPLAGVREAFPGFVVAEAATTAIVGSAAMEVCGDYALLRSVAVSPGWRHRGLGRALVTRVIADAEGRGLHALYLLTTTAEHYFPGFGFAPIARSDVPAALRETAEFRDACPDTATVMTRPCRGAA